MDIGEILSRYFEEITTYDKLVEALRGMFLDYADRLVELEDNYEDKMRGILNEISLLKGTFIDIPPYEPRSFAVFDGASATMDLEAGYIGVYAALAILFPGMKRIYSRDSYGIVPQDPSRLKEVSEHLVLNRLLDLTRERKVMELAERVVKEYRPEIVLIDGSLMPVPRTGLEDRSDLLMKEYDRYFGSICRLHFVARSHKVLLIGFVKRVRSKLLRGETKNLQVSLPPRLERLLEGLPDLYDVLIVDMILGQGEYFPRRPILIRHSSTEDIRIASIFIKPREDTTPFRLDIGGVAIEEEDIAMNLVIKALGFIKNYMTSLGLPYPILKVDEEVKLSRRLIREIYDDMRYRYLHKGKGRILSIKTVWGEYL